MPYLVTISDRPRDWPGAPDWPGKQTRQYVDTLDEAREATQAAVDSAGPIKSRHSWEAICGYIAHTMDETGGTIGPLPDGRLIVVRPTQDPTSR